MYFLTNKQDCQIEASLISEVSGTHHDELVDTAYEAKETRTFLITGTQTPQENQLQHSVVVGRSDTSLKSQVFPMTPYLPPPGPRPRGDGCDDDALSRRSSNQDSLNGNVNTHLVVYVLSLEILIQKLWFFSHFLYF